MLKATTTDPTAPIVVPGTPDGDKQVKPVPGPENIYEVLDGNGNSKVPPEYIYDPGGSFKEDPPRWSGDEVPAYKDGYIYYAEELPLGSNIFTPIKEDGTRDYDNAVWGGANKKPGGGDDRKAVKDGSVWYAEDPAGSNLWKPVQTALLPNQGTLTDSDWKGGGADGLPSGNDNLFPIIYHDGAYYAGPFNDGVNTYYIGTGANGRFDTSGNNGIPVSHAAAGDDKKLYWNGTGLPGGGGTGEFDVNPPSSLTITSSSMPDALVGSAYSENLTATGTGTITWSLVSGYGNLPSGFSLSSAGVISGTCFDEGTYTFTVKATNAGGSVTQEVTLKVKAGIEGLLPNSPINTVYEIDGVEWIKAGSYSDGENYYAMLVRKENYGNNVFFCTTTNPTFNYFSTACVLRNTVTNFYNTVIKGDQPTLWAAMVLPVAGLGGAGTAAASLPTSTRAKGNPQTADVAFILSHGEANSWGKENAANGTTWWTRTHYPASGNYDYVVDKNGNLIYQYSTWDAGMRPAVWVMVAK